MTILVGKIITDKFARISVYHDPSYNNNVDNICHQTMQYIQIHIYIYITSSVTANSIISPTLNLYINIYHLDENMQLKFHP